MTIRQSSIEKMTKLRGHSIVPFADRVIFEGQPPMSADQIDALQALADGSMPEAVVGLWQVTASGRLDYDLNVPMHEDALGTIGTDVRAGFGAPRLDGDPLKPASYYCTGTDFLACIDERTHDNGLAQRSRTRSSPSTGRRARIKSRAGQRSATRNRQRNGRACLARATGL